MVARISPQRTCLLARLANPFNEEAWTEFGAIYAPMLQRYATEHGLPESSASRVVAVCLVEVRTFADRYSEWTAFLSWVRSIADDEIRLRLSDTAHPPAEDPSWRERFELLRKLEHLRFLLEEELPRRMGERDAFIYRSSHVRSRCTVAIEQNLTIQEVAAIQGAATDLILHDLAWVYGFDLRPFFEAAFAKLGYPNVKL